MGVKSADMLGDSMLVVRQMKGESQCLDKILNEYRGKCLDIMKTLDAFCIHHIPREENKRANALAQQTSAYEVAEGLVVIKGKLWHNVHLQSKTSQLRKAIPV
jgi:ribonuclease HI